MKTLASNHDRLTICLVCGLAMILIVILSLLSNGVKREPSTPTLEQIPKEELVRYKTIRQFLDSPKRADDVDIHSILCIEIYRRETEDRYPILKTISGEELGITHPSPIE